MWQQNYLDACKEHDHSPVIAGTHHSADGPIQIMCASLVSNLWVAAHGNQPVRGEGTPTLLHGDLAYQVGKAVSITSMYT